MTQTQTPDPGPKHPVFVPYPMFENDDFKFSGIQTSRCFWGMVNFSEENPSASIMLDPAVRKAIALGINKEGFVQKSGKLMENGIFT